MLGLQNRKPTLREIRAGFGTLFTCRGPDWA
jgi:hypothetical protein